MADTFPEFIGKYKVQGIIAKGGMGVVYKAIHPSLKRFVVIKKMTARRNASNAERFKREAQILLDLQSPYIVHLFDYFTEGSYRYMVEELVDGMAVDKLLEKQKILSPQVAMLILQDACYALKFAHSKDIVHRDIKPGNILISKRAEIKLADFGIASDKEEATASLTQTGVALGTPAYMPPEQFEDSAKVDSRADIYALGIMLYEMTTGTKPYPGTLSIETLNTIKKGKYVSPRKIDKTIPRAICRLINKMIKPKAKNRFKTVDPVIKAIKKYFKHYDTHEIRVGLAKMIVHSAFVQEPPYTQKDLKVRRAKKIVAISAMAIVAFLTAWKIGFIHRTILRPWFTPVKVEIQMPETQGSLDLPVCAYFFENDASDFPEVQGSRRILTLKKDKKSKSKYKEFASKDVFLRPGDYRVKLAVGPYVWWKSFSVSSSSPLMKNGTYLLDFPYLKDTRRQIKVIPNAVDAKTGKNILDKTTVQVNYNGAWTLLSEVPPEKILSNTVWKFKFSADGYKDEIFSLRFDWYQDELFVSASMEKN